MSWNRSNRSIYCQAFDVAKGDQTESIRHAEAITASIRTEILREFRNCGDYIITLVIPTLLSSEALGVEGNMHASHHKSKTRGR